MYVLALILSYVSGRGTNSGEGGIVLCDLYCIWLHLGEIPTMQMKEHCVDLVVCVEN